MQQLPLEVLSLISPILCWTEFPDTYFGQGDTLYGAPEKVTTDLFFDTRSKHYRPNQNRREFWVRQIMSIGTKDQQQEVLRLSEAIDPDDKDIPFCPPNDDINRPLAPPRGYNLVIAFQRLINRYFQWAGGELRIRSGLIEELHILDKRFAVRHLILHAYADASVKYGLVTEDLKNMPVQLSQLHLNNQGFRNVVDRGLTETHLHLKGMLNADVNWGARLLMQPQVPDYVSLNESQRIYALGFLICKILSICLMRSRLLFPPFAGLRDIVNKIDQFFFGSKNRSDRQVFDEIRSLWEEDRKDLADLLCHIDTSHFDSLTWLMPIVGTGLFPSKYRAEETILSAPRRDIHTSFLVSGRFNLELQKHLISLSGSKKSEELHWGNIIRALFQRMLIVHTLHWRRAISHSQTTGLNYFRETFHSEHRLPDWYRESEKVGWIMRRLGEDRTLKRVEGRLSIPDGSWEDVNVWLRAYAMLPKYRSLDNLGIIFHFQRDKGGTDRVREMLDFDYRHGRIRRTTRRQAFKLFHKLAQSRNGIKLGKIGISEFAVGLDVCSLELPTPPEVFAPTFRFLRDQPIFDNLAKPTNRHGPDFGEADPHLRMTYHVGEDFLHILSGLRAVSEVITFLNPQSGDRLGHGLALGLDVETWSRNMGDQAVLSRQEWLDNLIWLRDLLGEGHKLISKLNINDRIQALLHHIYSQSWHRPLDVMGRAAGAGLDILPFPGASATLADAWRLRQLDPECFDLLSLWEGTPRMQTAFKEHWDRYRWHITQEKVFNQIKDNIGAPQAYVLVGLYWFDLQVFQRGSKRLTVDFRHHRTDWLALYHEVQEHMLQQVVDHGLVVETNPSSNWCVGPIEEFKDHPIFRFANPKSSGAGPYVTATVNTDNPGVFSTSLSHEFYLLGEVLLKQGMSEREAAHWLEGMRQNGADYSFLPKAGDWKHERKREILSSLRTRRDGAYFRIQGEPRTLDHWWPEKETP